TMAYAHSKGVIHRDLKPSNVMLGPFGETLVVDWGLAKLLHGPEEAMTVVGAAFGTANYWAPEQASGRLDLIDERTDVYLLGGILFEILPGRPPHAVAGRSAAGQSARAVRPSVPAALDIIVSRALEPVHEDRWPSAAALAAEVQRWLADEPLLAYRT